MITATLTILYLIVLYPWLIRWGATNAGLSMPLGYALLILFMTGGWRAAGAGFLV